jgi:UDP-N-acetyl-2-amino-2-deoxyglucuronate dehydrogenase
MKKNNFIITTINDEVSSDFKKAVSFLKNEKISHLEVRTINNKNLINYSFREIREFSNVLKKNNIKVSAFASPLFKWYPNNKKVSAEKVDTFNFSPYLSIKEKKKYIEKAFEVAKILNTNYIRIFSTLKNNSKNYNFLKDPLLQFTLEKAKEKNIVLLLENEPPCYINKMKDIELVVKKINSENFGIWLDVANFYKINEQVFLEDIKRLKSKIKYIHLKDFDANQNYTIFGEGIINYKRIISDIKEIFEDKNIFLSIETHVSKNPKNATKKSLEALKKIISEKRVRYAIIGCGLVFAKHGLAVSSNKKSELRAVFDINKNCSKNAAKQFDCENKKSFDSVLKDKTIDVINIRTPNDTHQKLVLKTIKSGKICLCEKPLCLTSNEGKEIVNSKFYKKNVFVNFQNKFNPAISTLFKIIEEKKLGKIVFCSINIRWWRENFYFNDWHGKKRRVGGILYNQGAHAINIMNKICGQIKEVEKTTKHLRKNSEVEDIYLAVIKFRNGILGKIEMTTYTKYRNCEASLLLIGERGTIKLSGLSFNEIEFFSTKEDVDGKSIKTMVNKKEDSHFRLIEALNNYILNGEKDERLSFAEEGLDTTETTLKLYR